jgi:hypothetical protein
VRALLGQLVPEFRASSCEGSEAAAVETAQA